MRLRPVTLELTVACMRAIRDNPRIPIIICAPRRVGTSTVLNLLAMLLVDSSSKPEQYAMVMGSTPLVRGPLCANTYLVSLSQDGELLPMPRMLQHERADAPPVIVLSEDDTVLEKYHCQVIRQCNVLVENNYFEPGRYVNNIPLVGVITRGPHVYEAVENFCCRLITPSDAVLANGDSALVDITLDALREQCLAH